ncbi:phosphopantetheinyl transferase [Pseudomonas amygdali pv. tabaci str. ATCC 11528]|uniref:4'-phosphopantetheinyl transferase family protein n=1 Tax=Pseudomonas amygdali TaxID=47877 RepID=UPI0001BC9E90|nr:4'-phosphopantetheinyl transferase superfamily protein [Pseudomonas amygdali]KEZ69357.1 phosphopantetheinyl transferase [Pseudomonas amygdali pv. tabaci str. ATCC 11528]KKY50025.1 phosphopantetheinyl transferase [Pseudomonas amygdali pv. tabaci str. ATCC 11528]QED86812.1 4'-phosphopantetheinyl transferase superfamily protein [Pseudomonas amygdali pv. tabaci str. ATCC 11528]
MKCGASWAFDEDGRLAPPESFPRQNVLLVSCVTRPGCARDEARNRIRACVRIALEQWLELPSGAITFISAPGVAPRLLIDGLPEPGFSISHEAGFSLAAVNLQGAVGVDLMQVQAVPDWHAVALDYLGAEVASVLSGMPESMRAVVFAKAWCRREAFLKLHGLALDEWTAQGGLQGVEVEVELAEGMVGAVALSQVLMEYMNQAERRTSP